MAAKKAPVKKSASVKKAAPAKKAPAKKAPVKKASVKKAAPAKKAPAKKAPVKKAAPAKKAPAKKAPAKKASVKKAAPAKKAPAKKAPAKKAPVKKAAPAKKAPVKKAPAKKAPVKKAAPAKVAPPAAPEVKKVSPAPAPQIKKAKKPEPPKRPVIVKGPSQDGVTSTKEFDLKFLFAQREALLEERTNLIGQARVLEREANSLIEDAEMGDVQFEEEGGEGDTMAVQREQDLNLSAQALQTVEEIDAALARMKKGEYGYSVVSGLPIPKERLKAIPWATELVTERAGVLNRF